jgi:hypothetical protein
MMRNRYERSLFLIPASYRDFYDKRSKENQERGWDLTQ